MPAEHRRHGGPRVDHSLVVSLANEYHRSEAEVAEILQDEVERITADARIATFVMVLATRHARSRLRSATRTSH